MLLFGHIGPPSFGEDAYPKVKFALLVPTEPLLSPAVLHGADCPDFPKAGRALDAGVREVVYATTCDELDDYATGQFGEDGWCPCQVCGG